MNNAYNKIESENISSAALFIQLNQSQKSRDELMKWKLIVIATIGAAGLGIVEKTSLINMHLLITIIPITCVYIDLPCRNLSIRTKRISFFLSKQSEIFPNNIDCRYAVTHSAIKPLIGKSFESYALIWSTIFISISITTIGFLINEDFWVKRVLVGTGIICIFLSILIERVYEKRTEATERAIKSCKQMFKR